MRDESSIDALANQIDNEGFWDRVRLDSNNWVTATSFDFPNPLENFKTYLNILVLDY